MSIPCRCNRRECQARRNLPKRPECYAKWPVCRKCNVGLLYVDEYRLRRGAKDNAPVCRNSMCLAGLTTDCSRAFPHRVSTEGCIGYEEWVRARNEAGRSKHSPIPPDEWVPF